MGHEIPNLHVSETMEKRKQRSPHEIKYFTEGKQPVLNPHRQGSSKETKFFLMQLPKAHHHRESSTTAGHCRSRAEGGNMTNTAASRFIFPKGNHPQSKTTPWSIEHSELGKYFVLAAGPRGEATWVTSSA